MWHAYVDTGFPGVEIVAISTTTPIRKLVTASLLTEGPPRGCSHIAGTWDSRRLAAHSMSASSLTGKSNCSTRLAGGVLEVTYVHVGDSIRTADFVCFRGAIVTAY